MLAVSVYKLAIISKPSPICVGVTAVSASQNCDCFETGCLPPGDLCNRLAVERLLVLQYALVSLTGCILVISFYGRVTTHLYYFAVGYELLAEI